MKAGVAEHSGLEIGTTKVSRPFAKYQPYQSFRLPLAFRTLIPLTNHLHYLDQ
jgi:hypothetical protein